MRCLRCDGRTVVTRPFVDKDGTKQLELVKEDHCVIVSYPGNTYIDHIAPPSGRSANITKELISVVREKTAEKTLTAIVCDGTSVMSTRYTSRFNRRVALFWAFAVVGILAPLQRITDHEGLKDQ